MALEDKEQLTVKDGMEAEWEESVNKNRDSYGYGVVLATSLVGKALDEGKSPEEADNASDGIGITGFMAGCVAHWIAHYHPRGEEFRRWWNKAMQIHDEGEKANESGGVLNPALLNIG